MHAAGSDETLAKAVAAYPQAQVQKIATHAAAVIGRRQKSHVAAQCAKVANVIGNALQFQTEAHTLRMTLEAAFEPELCPSTSTGLCCGPSFEAAALGALCEVIDQNLAGWVDR